MTHATPRKRILVTGASIAGTACAYWLLRAGPEVTVVERAEAFREGGQNVDIRGAAKTVLHHMGLEQAVRDHGTRETGVAFVDDAGTVVAEFAQDDGDGLTAELEILRGELSRLFYDRCRDRAEFRFGDSVTAIDQLGDTVRVDFESGSGGRFDVVVVAEGVGSSTRELVFPGENDPRWLDVEMGYFSIPRAPHDTDLARWYNAPGGRSVFLRPDREGSTTRAVLTIQKKSDGEEDLDPDAQRSFLKSAFQDAGWETERVLRGLDETDDFYFDVLRQVRMKHWSAGRVVLTGDAAWCVTPLAGRGTSLAIIGAYVLAGELSTKPTVTQALADYEHVMRPFVEEVQNVPSIGPRIAQPRSRLGIALQRTLLGVAAKPAVRDIVKKAFTGSDDRQLPTYDF